jgi:hypothetical protein
MSQSRNLDNWEPPEFHLWLSRKTNHVITATGGKSKESTGRLRLVGAMIDGSTRYIEEIGKEKGIEESTLREFTRLIRDEVLAKWAYIQLGGQAGSICGSPDPNAFSFFEFMFSVSVARTLSRWFPNTEYRKL